MRISNHLHIYNLQFKNNNNKLYINKYLLIEKVVSFI